MKILVVGSGGREHALCAAIKRSSLCSHLLCAPGNAGIALVADCRAVAAEDVDGQVALAQREKVDLVVVGPEAPLVAGLVDRLEAAGIRAFGPRAAAARLEGSKAFMKEICDRALIPTAAWGRFTDADAARAFIRERGAPIVVKADGLAAGKGVVVAGTEAEALAAVDQIMGARLFGAAGETVVIEEFLAGEEASFFALCDGTDAISLGAAQDHKRVGDGDTGPNTGGMGAYTPAPIVTPAIEVMVMERIIRPTLATMAEAGMPFRGVLFAGLMIEHGAAKLLEFNVRFGDPECEALMARLDFGPGGPDACRLHGRAGRAADRMAPRRGDRGRDGGTRLSRRLRQGIDNPGTGRGRRRARRRRPACGDRHRRGRRIHRPGRPGTRHRRHRRDPAGGP